MPDETSENRQMVLRMYEEVGNQGRIEVLDELCQPDYVEHSPLPGQGPGVGGLKQRLARLRAAFDPNFTIEHLIADGDKIAVMWTNRGTHRGEWFGIPPTGKTFAISGVDIHLLRDGRLAEHWDVVDVYSMLIQIGVIPDPSSTREASG